MNVWLERECLMNDCPEPTAGKIRYNFVMATYNISILAYTIYSKQTRMLWKTIHSDNEMKFNICVPL